MESTRVHNNVTSSFNLATSGWATTTKNTFIEEVESFSIFTIANFVNTYWFPVLVPIGLVGNTLSLLVMLKTNNRKISTCIYMAALSINDNIMMCGCFHDYLVSVLHIHKWNPIECKLNVFVTLFALQNCTFLILAMTLDKYIAIKWPHKAATYSTPRRAKIISAGLYVCIFIYTIPPFFLSSVLGDQCVAYGISTILSRVYSWFSFVLNAIIPFTMLIHMNYIIVKTVRNSRKMFGTNGIDTRLKTRQKTMKSAENQVTIMLLLVTTLFFVLLFPTYFRFIYLSFAERDTPLGYARAVFIFQISFKLYATNSGINFFLYCISGQKFRNDLKEILYHCAICYPSPTRGKDEPQSVATEISTVYTKNCSSLPP